MEISMKQKIITFANHKGGVSKTTSTIILPDFQTGTQMAA